MVCRDDDGDWYAYSFGGYHADDDERTDTRGRKVDDNPYLKRSPIDVDVCDVGKEVKKLCLKDWIDKTRGLVIFVVHYISR